MVEEAEEEEEEGDWRNVGSLPLYAPSLCAHGLHQRLQALVRVLLRPRALRYYARQTVQSCCGRRW